MKEQNYMERVVNRKAEELDFMSVHTSKLVLRSADVWRDFRSHQHPTSRSSSQSATLAGS